MSGAYILTIDDVNKLIVLQHELQGLTEKVMMSQCKRLCAKKECVDGAIDFVGDYPNKESAILAADKLESITGQNCWVIKSHHNVDNNFCVLLQGQMNCLGLNRKYVIVYCTDLKKEDNVHSSKQA